MAMVVCIARCADDNVDVEGRARRQLQACRGKGVDAGSLNCDEAGHYLFQKITAYSGRLLKDSVLGCQFFGCFDIHHAQEFRLQPLTEPLRHPVLGCPACNLQLAIWPCAVHAAAEDKTWYLLSHASVGLPRT